MSGILENVKDTVQSTAQKITGGSDMTGNTTQGAAGFETGAGNAQQTQDLADAVPDTSDAVRKANVPKDHQGGHNPAKAFGSGGIIGKEFNPEGSIGGTAQKVADSTGADSLDKNGSVGHKFTSSGTVGGNIDKAVNEKK